MENKFVLYKKKINKLQTIRCKVNQIFLQIFVEQSDSQKVIASLVQNLFVACLFWVSDPSWVPEMKKFVLQKLASGAYRPSSSCPVSVFSRTEPRR